MGEARCQEKLDSQRTGREQELVVGAWQSGGMLVANSCRLASSRNPRQVLGPNWEADGIGRSAAPRTWHTARLQHSLSHLGHPLHPFTTPPHGTTIVFPLDLAALTPILSKGHSPHVSLSATFSSFVIDVLYLWCMASQRARIDSPSCIPYYVNTNDHRLNRLNTTLHRSQTKPLGSSFSFSHFTLYTT